MHILQTCLVVRLRSRCSLRVTRGPGCTSLQGLRLPRPQSHSRAAQGQTPCLALASLSAGGFHCDHMEHGPHPTAWLVPLPSPTEPLHPKSPLLLTAWHGQSPAWSCLELSRSWPYPAGLPLPRPHTAQAAPVSAQIQLPQTHFVHICSRLPAGSTQGPAAGHLPGARNPVSSRPGSAPHTASTRHRGKE